MKLSGVSTAGFLFIKIDLVTSGLLKFHVILESDLSSFGEKTQWDYNRDFTETVDQFWKYYHLNTIVFQFINMECLCSWNSPGQNTGVGSLSLLQGSPLPRDRTHVSHIAGEFFSSWATREALVILYFPSVMFYSFQCMFCTIFVKFIPEYFYSFFDAAVNRMFFSI